jgi:hypothetical protein
MSGTVQPRSLSAALIAAAYIAAAATRVGASDPRSEPASTEREFRHGASELFWVPTLEQGVEMARATGRPLFVMGYSLVQDGSTYTKLGEEFAACVF